MIMVNQDHDHRPSCKIARCGLAAWREARWRGSSPSRRATMRRIRGGRSAPRPSPGTTGKAGASYYLSPAEKGGEPPGRWHGGGLAELGFRDGQVIEREVFERLYGDFIDPRDPTGAGAAGTGPAAVPSGGRDLRRAGRAGAGGDRRAPRRADDRGEVAGQDACAVLRRDVQRVEVDHVAARVGDGQRRQGRRRRGPGSGRVLGAGRRRRVGLHRGRQPGGAGLPAARGRVHPVGLSRPAGRRGPRRAAGRTPTGSSSARSRSTPAATATRSCTSTTWSSTGCSGSATAPTGRWTRGRCTSTAARRRRSPRW